MKKLISAFLAMTCVFGLSFGVWADDSKKFDSEDDGKDPPYECEVPVSVSVDTGDTDIRYNVVVSWKEVEFTYDRGDSEWQPEDVTGATPVTGHTYTDEGEWDTDEVDSAISVANHSNAEVAVSVSTLSNIKGVTVTPSISSGNATLKSAAIDGIYGVYANADKVSYKLTATGVPEFDGKIELGKVKVTVSAVK